MFSTGLFVSCSNAPGGGTVQGFFSQLQKEINAALNVLQGKRSDLAQTGASPAPSRFSASEEKERANAELLREVFWVVFRQEPQAGNFFSGYLASLNQGASFEGIYNGFTHSAHYRQLESAHPGPVSKTALAFFLQQMTDLQELLPEKTNFTLQSGKPLANMMSMGEMEASAQDEDENSQAVTRDSGAVGVTEIDFSKKRKAVRTQSSPLPVSLAEIFSHSSIYTLKRVLSDETLKWIEVLRKRSVADLARWYGLWAAGMNRNGVAYGLALRNRADADFHEQWALQASADALTWEVLNRIHRTLNHFEKNP